MKRKILSFIMMLSAVILLQPCGKAQNNENTGISYYVSDVAGAFTDDEWQLLETEAERISEEHGIGTYFVILDDYRSYGNYSSFYQFSEAFYNGYQMGLGEEKNGILLIMSLDDRDYSLIAHGSAAHYAFTDYGKEVLEDSFLDDFKYDRWFSGCRDYLDCCDKLLNQADQGEPLDVSYENRDGISDAAETAIVVLVPLFSAFGACEGMKHQMKPVKEKSGADEYIVPGGINLDIKRDAFVSRTVTRTLIKTEPRDSHGGGGTTINSSGFSGHSGKF